MQPNKSRQRNDRRRASMYITVLGTTVAVAMLGLSALMAIRVQRRTANDTGDFAKARLYARSAIEMGLLRIENDANWRTTYPSGVWESNRSIGDGTYTLEGIDPDDGILSDGDAHPVQFTGIGMQGDARYKLQVRLEAGGGALTCLEVAMHAGVDLTFDGLTLTSDRPVSANNNIVTSGFTAINADVEAVGTISGSGYGGTRTAGIAPRDMPDATAFDYYVDPANSATIDFASIPRVQGKSTIQDVLISPTSNPYGLSNSNGIYVVDCGGAYLRIRNTRIVGTLVVLNNGGFSVQGSVSWDPAIANYPALLVSGSAELAFTNAALQEASAGVDFNEDGDTLDTFASRIAGLIYASSDVDTLNYVTVDGVLVIGGTLSAADDLILTYQSLFLNDPPPGFGGAAGHLQIASGTWRRVVD